MYKNTYVQNMYKNILEYLEKMYRNSILVKISKILI